MPRGVTEIRDKEAADFAVEEKEFTTVIDMLHRAVAGSLVDALAVMVKASSINAMDATCIASVLLLSTIDADDDMAAPDAGVYQSSSGGIIDTLNGLLDNFDQLKQS